MSKRELKPGLKEFQASDIELAEHLLSLRQEPSVALRQRIQSIPRQKAPQIRALPRLAWGSVALLVIAALLFTSPTAKAMLGEVEQAIGRIQLMVMDVLPKPIWGDVSPTATEPIIVESTPMSLAEAQAFVPFDFIIPTYLPDGLISGREVLVTRLETPLVTIRWRDTEGGFVQLTAYPYNTEDSPIQTLIGPDSSQTVLINGQKAVAVAGAWNQTSRTWSHDSQVITLIWEVDNIQYKLISFSQVAPLTELIAIAESVR
jgi:hypothetical protein